jgi:hypothetical protein
LSGMSSWLLNHISNLVGIVLVSLLGLPYLLLLLDDSVTRRTSTISLMSCMLLVNLLSRSFV